MDKKSLEENDDGKKKKSDPEIQQQMAKSNFKFKIFITEEKFPSCSKMLEVFDENIVKFRIDSWDRINADYTNDTVRLSALRIKVREGGFTSQTIKNFNSQLRSLLINNERGGIQNFFDALYTKEYISKISEDEYKFKKMVRLHNCLVRLMKECLKSALQYRQVVIDAE